MTSAYPLVSHISIHALREEGDWSSDISLPSGIAYFYPRPPRGGRRVRHDSAQGHGGISIHALREEGDNDTDLVHERR